MWCTDCLECEIIREEGTVSGIVECIVAQGMAVRAGMGMEKISMSMLDLEVCIYNLLWQNGER